MITLEQEEAVRKLLEGSKTKSDKQIARETGVSYWTVGHLRGVCRIAMELPLGKRAEIRRLFLANFPPKAVASNANVSHKVALAVRRYCYLCPRKTGNAGLRKCPACGAMMFGDPQDRPSRIRRKGMVVLPVDVSEKNVDALYRVATDVCDLDEMCLVHSPLFHHLARRAEKILRKING